MQNSSCIMLAKDHFTALIYVMDNSFRRWWADKKFKLEYESTAAQVIKQTYAYLLPITSVSRV